MKSSKDKPIKTADELLNSPWGRDASRVKNPVAIASQASAIAGKFPNSRLAQRVSAAAGMVQRGGLNGRSLDAKSIVLLTAALLYVICPIDVIPDMIPIVGWLDDIGVLGIAVYYAGAAISALTGSKKTEEEEDAADGDLVDLVAQQASASRQCYQPATTLQDELAALHREAEELQDDVLMEQCRELQSIALDPVRRVIVTGTFNAGKSSLINRLLGGACLPVGILPTTSVVTTLLHGESFLAVSSLADGGIESSADAEVLRRTDSPFYKGMKELIIYHPADILNKGFSIVDTPGLRDQKYELNFDELPRSDAFLYLKSLDAADFTPDELAFMAKAAGHVSAEQMILVLSKVDAVETPEELDALERELRAKLTPYGLGNIAVFRVTDRGKGDMLPELRQELLSRASHSLEEQHDARVREAAGAVRNAIVQTRQHRAEMEALSQAERAQRKAKLAERLTRANDLIARRVDACKDLVRSDLHDYLFSTLYPSVCASVDQSRISEAYVGQLTVQIRNELGSYLEARCKELARQLGTKPTQEDIMQLRTSSSPAMLTAPEQPISDMADYARYVLPGIALVTFFPMGILSWLTTIAVPTLLMDKCGAGEGLSKLLRSVGQSGARAQLKEAVRGFLLDLEQQTLPRINEFLDRTALQVSRLQAKQLENQS